MAVKLLSTKKINKKTQYQFGIRKEIKFNKTESLVPIFRQKRTLAWSPWIQIVKIYDTYRIMDFDGDVELTEEECLSYISEYKKIIEEPFHEKIETIETYSLEDDVINNIDKKSSEEVSSIFSKIRSYLSQLF